MKIAAVTGGRADWGLLSVVLAALRRDPAFDVSLIVTGQHLAGERTASLNDIAQDGFSAYERVDIEIGDDSPSGVARSTGLAVAGIAAALARIQPQLVLLLGDRYEILAAATAALIHRIPVAHLCGGDLTEGAMDDAIRHAITKLAHIHFVTNDDAKRRVIQMGEAPEHVHCVGSPGLDRIARTPILDRAAWLATVGLPDKARTIIVTYHPATLATDTLQECREMLSALHALGEDVAILFTGANADPDARGIDLLIADFVALHDNAVAHQSLGAAGYLNALAHVDAVVGNSSSGLYEAPSFGIATVNIGERQHGRLRAASVIDCIAQADAILTAIQRSFSLDCTAVTNPYGDGHAAERIVSVLKTLSAPSRLVRKQFFDPSVTRAA